MMYSEFIQVSGKEEKYISYVEYTTFIEPIYTDCELSKVDFIRLMNEAFAMIVYPAVEKAIRKLSLEEKLALCECCSASVANAIEKVDFEARKIAYEYMKLYSKL